MKTITTGSHPSLPGYVQPYRYPSPNIPRAAIKRFARRIADKFHPEKVILFGSYAYGTPHAESDVDLLVVMPTSDPMAASVRISTAFDWPFSLDLNVRTPKQMERGLRPDDCDWFLREIVEKGIILYEAAHRPRGYARPRTTRRQQEASPLCQSPNATRCASCASRHPKNISKPCCKNSA